MSWTPLFKCLTCEEPIEATPSRPAACARCARPIRWDNAIYRGLEHERAAALAPFLGQYQRVRADQGYRDRPSTYYEALPKVAADDPVFDTWCVRRRSFDRLCALIRARYAACRLKIADLGAGNGWLSNRLAELGHELVAVDALDDGHDGLGVCTRYRHHIVCIQADFDRLPLAPRQFDVVVFNDALHHAPNPIATLRRAMGLLAARGMAAVMDSPMFDSDLDGLAMNRRQDEHLQSAHHVERPVRGGPGYLTLPELADMATELRAESRFYRSRGPVRWETGRAWARVRRGLRPAQFGVWVAQW